jgi:hypothetical protein
MVGLEHIPLSRRLALANEHNTNGLHMSVFVDKDGDLGLQSELRLTTIHAANLQLLEAFYEGLIHTSSGFLLELAAEQQKLNKT